jgi:hypothetical protein
MSACTTVTVSTGFCQPRQHVTLRGRAYAGAASEHQSPCSRCDQLLCNLQSPAHPARQ